MVLKIGHRGACGYEPENTILSFKKALELNVDMIEMDIHLSKDNQVIVIHDETLDRTTDGKGRVSEKTLDEIKNCKTKEKGQPIPTLQEVIDEFKSKTKFNFEIKGLKPAEEVSKIIKKNSIEKDVIVSSNHVKTLLTIKRILPDVDTALIHWAAKTERGQDIFNFFSLKIFPLVKIFIIKKAGRAKVSYLHLHHDFAEKNFVKKLHGLGFKVNVWTVNEKEVIKKMKELGVDGIFSNFPDRI